QPAGVRVGQRLQQHRVHHAVDRDGRRDAQADGQHAGGGEQPALEQRAERDAEILARGRGSSSGSRQGDVGARVSGKVMCPAGAVVQRGAGYGLVRPSPPAGTALRLPATATTRPAAGHLRSRFHGREPRRTAELSLSAPKDPPTNRSLDDSPRTPPIAQHTNTDPATPRSRTMRRHLSLALAAAALACGRPQQPVPDLSGYRLVDLTHAYNAEPLYWPTSPTRFQLEQLAFGPTPGGWFYAANAFAAPEHGGTHLDAPIHFAEGRLTADRIPLEKLVAPAVVIDVTAQAEADPDYRLEPSDITAFERLHGTIAPGTIVLLRTGWSSRWPDARAYLGDDTPGDADRKSTRLNSSHVKISYAVFCLK